MQTFLPYESFSRSAASLDKQRLNKQCVECIQIGGILLRKRGLLPLEYNGDKPKKGFWNHPAVKMWEGYEWPFLQYFQACIWEAQARFIKVDRYQNILRQYQDVVKAYLNAMPPKPPAYYDYLFSVKWLGGPIHLSHQSNLIRKNPSFYAEKFPGVPSNLPYVWPV